MQNNHFRYDTSCNWFKGNTHIHSTHSDGGKTIQEIDALYAGVGYDFLFATDHFRPSNFKAEPDGLSLLWMDGVEIDGKDSSGAFYHVVCLGEVQEIAAKMPFQDALQNAMEHEAILILAHPHWCANKFEDAYRWPFTGVEIYNHVCHWLNGKGDGNAYWSAMLESNPNTLGFAVDDAHLRPEHPGWNGGWIMVNAPACTEDLILSAIRRGNFYASCGPEFRQIKQEDGIIRIQTSPVQFMRLVGPAWNGVQLGSFDGQVFEVAEFVIPGDWKYAYLEIEDGKGKRAWSNPLFFY
jgi:hypothetical protein